MHADPARPGIVMVAPGAEAQGGITTVIGNYGRTNFWMDFRCTTFFSTKDLDSKVSKLLHDLSRWLRFTLLLALGNKPRAASVHTAQGASFYRKLAYLVTCWVLRIPVVFHVHPACFAQFYIEGSVMTRWAIRLSGHLSDQIVVLSDSIKAQLIDAFPADKVTVLGNPVDIEMYASGQSFSRAMHPRILFLGWIVREKGVYDLVDAMSSVLDEFPDAVFIFAGNKEVPELRAMLAERGLANSSEVLGWVEGQRKLELLQTAWLLALPSYTEGIPNVILEAMASRLPIVTTAVGGIPSVLKNGETALFVEPGNSSSIGEAIKNLIRDEELRESISSAAFQRACDGYSLQVADEGLKTIYSRYFQDTPRISI